MASNIDDTMKKFTSIYTPEAIEELSRRCYIDDRECPEVFSNWYSHIKDFGKFRHADIISNQVFSYSEVQTMQETDIISKVNWERFNEILKPTLDLMKPNRVYNIKNGAFSNKFDFSTCAVTKEDLAKKLWLINYNSTMFDTGGYTELVVRDYIPCDRYKIPTIYNGMPLREEIRVFYNLDTKQIEYIVDYWDYDYCEPNLHSKSDKIVFNWFHNKYGDRKDKHKNIFRIIENQIRKDINTLKFDSGLNGIWSIDFMYVNDMDEYEGIWLIDMARAHRSAYYDPDKLSGGRNNE